MVCMPAGPPKPSVKPLPIVGQSYGMCILPEDGPNPNELPNRLIQEP